MRMIPAAAVAAVLALSGTPARAQDWSGAYAGLHLGYGAGRDDVTEINGARAYYPDLSGMVVGAQAGWQRQIERVVAGVELDAGYLGASGKTSRTDTFGTVTTTTDIGAYGTLSARVGYLVGPRWLVFGRVGVTLASLDGDTEQSCPATGCGLQPGRSETEGHSWGVTFGGGVERAVSERWSARVDYQYTDFRRELALPPAGSGPGWHHDTDLHIVKASISRRF